MGLSKLIQDAIKTISEQAVSVAPYDKTRGGVIKGIGDMPNTYNVQVDGVVYTNVKTTGGIIPNINDTVTVIFPTNNSSQMVINSVSTQSWIKGASEFIYPVGIYYWTSDENFDPNVAFSGTWEKIDAGVTLVSAGTGYTVSSGTSKDGGSEYIQAHTHSDNLTLPNHIHGTGGSASGNDDRFLVTSSSNNGVQRKTGSISGSGYLIMYSQDHAVPRKANTGNPTTNPSINGSVGAVNGATTGDAGNMPPYKCAYCWHRIL